MDQPVAVEPEWDAALLDLYASQRLPLLRLAVLLTDDRPRPRTSSRTRSSHCSAAGTRSTRPRPTGYLRTSVVNGVRTLYRRSRVARRHLHVAGPEDAVPSADLAVLLTEEHREVVEALRTLPRRQREVLVLRYWSELSEAEIADGPRRSRAAP